MAVKKSSKVVKKKWFKILAPALLKESPVGETLLADHEQLLGKKMTVGLGSITGEPQKQHTHVNLLVKDYIDGVFKTELLGWRILPAAVKKLVRRNRSRIDDSFVVLTKDNKYVRVKPIIITRYKAQRSVQTAVRKRIRTEIAKLFSQKNLKVLVSEILARRLQHGILKRTSKLFPIAIFDIRQFVIVSADKAKKMNVVRFVGEIRKNKPASQSKADSEGKGSEKKKAADAKKGKENKPEDSKTAGSAKKNSVVEGVAESEAPEDVSKTEDGSVAAEVETDASNSNKGVVDA